MARTGVIQNRELRLSQRSCLVTWCRGRGGVQEKPRSRPEIKPLFRPGAEVGFQLWLPQHSGGVPASFPETWRPALGSWPCCAGPSLCHLLLSQLCTGFLRVPHSCFVPCRSPLSTLRDPSGRGVRPASRLPRGELRLFGEEMGEPGHLHPTFLAPPLKLQLAPLAGGRGEREGSCRANGYSRSHPREDKYLLWLS